MSDFKNFSGVGTLGCGRRRPGLELISGRGVGVLSYESDAGNGYSKDSNSSFSVGGSSLCGSITLYGLLHESSAHFRYIWLKKRRFAFGQQLLANAP